MDWLKKLNRRIKEDEKFVDLVVSAEIEEMFESYGGADNSPLEETHSNLELARDLICGDGPTALSLNTILEDYSHPEISSEEDDFLPKVLPSERIFIAA